MASRQPASSPRRSWREAPSGRPAAPTTGSKAPLVALLAVAVLGLLAGFGWLVWQPAKPEPVTHFAALLTGESDLLSLPPILFEQATVAPLEVLDEQSDALKFVDASEAQLAGIGSAVEAALKQQTFGDDDRLIVYVSAHGVSDDGTPYVLARDYNLLSREAGRYSAIDLIEAVSRVKAATKLIVFDCARLAIHPRLGMAANEFASLVKAAAAKVDDPHLGILLAGNELEFSPLGLAERRSVLGGAVVDALVAGDGADGDADRNLTLGELTTYVVQKCAASRVAAPEPTLIACGAVDSDKELLGRTIFHVPPRKELQALNELLAKAPTKRKVAKAKSQGKPTPVGAAPAPPVAQVANNATATAAAGAATAPAVASDQKSPESKPPAGSIAQSGAAPAAGGAPAAPAGAPSAGSDAAAEAPVAAATSAGGGPTAASPAAAPAAPPAVADDRPPILQAWRMRDGLVKDEVVETGVLPADYAPQLWNELNAKLVALHLTLLGHASSGSDASSTELIQPYLRGLPELEKPDGLPVEGLTGELIETHRQYLATGQRERLQRLGGPYSTAVLELRRALVRANQFIQWHAAALAASGGAGAGAESAAEIERLLDRLQALDGAIVDFESQARQSWSDAKRLAPQLGRALQDVSDMVHQLSRRIDVQVQAISAGRSAARERELESLLATDLATAPQREQLLAALGGAVGKTAPAKSTAPRWSDFIDHLWLEVRLVQVADPTAPGWADVVNDVMRVRTTPSADDNVRREALRKGGRALRQFYEGLPARLTQLEQSRANDDGRTAERLVTLVHPRDVSSALGTTVGFVTARLEPPAGLALEAPPPTNLREGVETPVEWTLRVRNLSGRTKVTLVHFDARTLDVRFADDRESARPGDSRAFPARDGLKIALLVRPRQASTATTDARTGSIVLRVELDPFSPRMVATSEAKVVVPRPDRVELIASSVKPRFKSDGLLLQPYPNRSTTFAFALVNYGDEAKKLKVEMKAAPELQGPRERFIDAGWPPGRLLDSEGRVPPKLAAWAKSALDDAPVIASVEIELPADGKPHPLKLAPPKSEAPAEAPKPPAADGSAAAPPPAPKPPTSVDVTHGLVCRISDAGRRGNDVLKWVEIVPLHAYSYFDFEAGFVNDNAASSDIRFTARPHGVDEEGKRSLPPEIGEAPIPFVIRGDGTVIPAGPAAPNNFAANNEFVRLDVQPRANLRGDQTIAMDVDNVPRAMKWTVNFDDRTVEPDETPSIRIMRVGMAKIDQTPGRLYRTTPYVDFPPIDPKAWLPVVDVTSDGVCAFDVSRGIRPPLEVRLQVDAPRRAFNGVGDGSAVVVSWKGDASPGYNLYYDRDIRSEIVKFTDAGEMVVKSSVDDIVFNLPTPGVNNKPVTLTASLFIEGMQPATDKLTIVLDQAPPRIQAVSAPRTVIVGSKEMDLRAGVVDLSGVESVEAWFTPKRLRSKEDLDPKAAERLAILDPGLLQLSADEPRTLVLKATVPKEPNAYYLTLRVTDRSGQASDTLDQEHVVNVIPPPPPPKPGPLIGDLKGQVLLMPAGKPAPAGLMVSVKEKPAFSGTTDGEGKFVIKQLEGGAYTLLVEGLVTSRPVAGEQAVTLAAKGDYEWKTVVKAKVEWADPPKK